MKKISCIIYFLFFTLLPLSAFAYTILPLQHRFDITHKFLQPTDIAVGKNNLIYVMDGVNSQVKVFDKEGVFKFAFGKKGNQKGHFNDPVGITTDSAGRVYVADTRNQRVQIFSFDGTFERQIILPEDKNGKPPEPVDIAVNERLKHLYISDNNNHRVLVYSNPGFDLLSTRGSEGARSNQFRYPFLMAAGNDDSLFIVDVLNTRIQAWKQDKPVMSIGGFGVDLGQLYRPKGICVDNNDLVLVSDSVLGVIQAFNPDGSFSAVLGTEKGEVLKWKTPLGITVDDQGRLYVVEMLPNRVSVYDILYQKKILKD